MQMIPFRYKFGDKVKVKPLDWFKKHCEYDGYGYHYHRVDNTYIMSYFCDDMSKLCDTEVTIVGVKELGYCIKESEFTFADWMFVISEGSGDKDKEVKEESRMLVWDLLRAIGLENADTDMFTFKEFSETIYKFDGTTLMEKCGSGNFIKSDLTINDLITLAEQIELIYFVDSQKVYTIDLTREDGVAELFYYSSDEHVKSLADKGLLFKTKEDAKEYIDEIF